MPATRSYSEDSAPWPPSSGSGAVDRLEVLQFPVILGEGVPFSPPGTPRSRLQLERQSTFPDGTLRNVYTLA